LFAAVAAKISCVAGRENTRTKQKNAKPLPKHNTSICFKQTRNSDQNRLHTVLKIQEVNAFAQKLRKVDNRKCADDPWSICSMA